MEKEFIDYGKRINIALLQVIKEILQDLSNSKISSNHCFYITFNTTHKNVVVSDKLKKEYPKQMTIILQNQFWDLVVNKDSFNVTLSFNRVKEVLKIPFESIKRFNDPFVKFSLELEIRQSTLESTKKNNKKSIINKKDEESKKIVSLENFRKEKE
tara:strand:- start:443 stop:910 length:468 start_codon:yes stop_codon:yes gene_type:complete